MSNRIRAVVIGCGRIGTNFSLDPKRGLASTHAGAYSQCPDIDLVAVCDIDKDKAQVAADKFGARAYVNWHQALKDECPHIVSVCTPPETHERIVSDVARVPGVRAVFCEKPIATSSSAAMHMIQVCAEQDVALVINHQRRFSKLHQHYAGIVRGGRLGDVQQATCYYTGGLCNTGTHLVDLVRMYLGEIDYVYGFTSIAAHPNPQDSNVDGFMALPGGGWATLQACDVGAYVIFEIAILTTLGRFVVKDSGFTLQIEPAGENPRFTGYRTLKPAQSMAVDEEWLLSGVESIAGFVQGGPAPPSTGEDGLAALKIIEALRLSATYGGKLWRI